MLTIFPYFTTITIDKSDRVSCTIIVLSYAEIFLQQWILLQEMNTIGVIEPSFEVGIVYDLTSKMLLLFSGKGIPIIRSRHTRLRPLFAEGIVILAVEVFAACRRHLRHDTCTAQMIRQEIVHLRVRAVVRADDPAVVERGALECVYGSIIRRIYQRTNIECLLTIIILVPACSSIRKIFKKWE